MKPFLKPAETKALTLGLGLSSGYLALAIMITLYSWNGYKDQNAKPTKAKAEHAKVIDGSKSAKQ